MLPDMKMTKTSGLLLLVALTAALIYWFFQPYFDDPNNAYFNIYGDGFKNYATVMYHAKHDSTYLHYGGMNYPHGEHVLFTDGQPILANTIKFISRSLTDITDHTVAIINFAMFVSILLCGIFLYLIFTRLKLPVWYGVPVAIGLTFLSPPMFRMEAHYALSYSFVVPMFLYLLLLFEVQKRWLLSAVTAVLLIIVAQLHFYYFALAAALITAYFFFHWLRKINWQTTKTLALHYGIQVIIPLVFLQFWVNWGNEVTDRPGLPFGYLDYRAFWEGIFTGTTPFWQWLDERIGIRNLNIENRAFVGSVATIFAVALIFRWLFFRFKKSFLPFGEAAFIKNLFPAILVILFFACGLPFILPGGDVLLDYLGPFRQFRGWGRFSWIFYFGWNIIVWYSLYRIFTTIEKKWIRYALLVAAFAILGYEAYHTTKRAAREPWRSEALNKAAFEQSEAYWFKNTDPQQFQAVLPVPYYHVGSENFDFGAPGEVLRLSLIPGLHYNIPSLGVFLSRTSYRQTLAYLPIAFLPYRTYDFVNQLPNKKPLLVVIDRALREQMAYRYDYAYLLRNSELLYLDDVVEVRSLPLEAFDQSHRLWRQDIELGWQYAQEHFVRRGKYLLPDSTTQIIHLDFNENNAERIYQGAGAYEAEREAFIPFWKGQLPARENTLSAWVFVGADQHPRLNFKAWEIHPDGSETLVAHNATRFDMRVLDRNGWGLIEFGINLSDQQHPVRLELECAQMEVEKIWVDEVLIRPRGKTIFWVAGDKLVYDNFWFDW